MVPLPPTPPTHSYMYLCAHMLCAAPTAAASAGLLRKRVQHGGPGRSGSQRPQVRPRNRGPAPGGQVGGRIGHCRVFLWHGCPHRIDVLPVSFTPAGSKRFQQPRAPNPPHPPHTDTTTLLSLPAAQVSAPGHQGAALLGPVDQCGAVRHRLCPPGGRRQGAGLGHTVAAPASDCMPGDMCAAPTAAAVGPHRLEPCYPRSNPHKPTPLQGFPAPNRVEDASYNWQFLDSTGELQGGGALPQRGGAFGRLAPAGMKETTAPAAAACAPSTVVVQTLHALGLPCRPSAARQQDIPHQL